MTWIDFDSVEWHEAAHTAAFLAQDHIPLKVIADWQGDQKVDGGYHRVKGVTKPDFQMNDGVHFARVLAIAVMAAMKPMPTVVPGRNGTGDDADYIACIAEIGGWDGAEEFLRLHFETTQLRKSRRFKRLAVAVYERLLEAEVLDQATLQEIYESEQAHTAPVAA